MPPFITPLFNDFNRGPNQFYLRELTDFLCPAPRKGEPDPSSPLTLNAQQTLETAEGKYEFKLEKTADGKKITLDATLTRGGVTHKTQIEAAQVSANLYQVNKLVFDNKVERTDSRWEMSKVMAHIGKEQLLKSLQGALPKAHEERGKFGKFARFCDRWLIPDNPMITPGI